MTGLTLGSLFDGIGGFPLAGIMAGITPLWASEIEPFPIRVTRARLPEMRHYGDIHSLHGGALPSVDMITFGSPCQNLSIAGKRAGLAGAQSSLFFEAVRIIMEMRENTNGRFPRWAVWENVPGALSSNAGQDFRQVLESLVHIKEPKATVPLPEGGKWIGAGEILGDSFSVAWRILDAAKGWGVAQRRRRIFAVIDLDGGCAGKVLFESEGVSGYTPSRYEAWKRIASPVERSIGTAERNRLKQNRIRATKVYGIGAVQSQGMLSPNPTSGYYEAKTSRTVDRNAGSPNCNQGGMLVVGFDVPCYCMTTSSYTQIDKEICSAIAAKDYKSPNIIACDKSYAMNRAAFHQSERSQFGISVSEEVAQTITAEGPGAAASSKMNYHVRRLTPGECCRLQGYPDGWCENLVQSQPSDGELAFWMGVFAEQGRSLGKKRRPPTRKQIVKWLQSPGTDAAIYKAYGNSVAVPCVFFVLAGIAWAANHEKRREEEDTLEGNQPERLHR